MGGRKSALRYEGICNDTARQPAETCPGRPYTLQNVSLNPNCTVRGAYARFELNSA